MQYPHSNSKCFSARFSLVELLVVACISGIICCAILPVISKLFHRDAVMELAASIKQGLEVARHQAVNNRKNVALVIPNGNNDEQFYSKEGFGPPPTKDCLLSSTRIMELDNDLSPAAWISSRWTKPVRSAQVMMVTSKRSELPQTGVDNHIDCSNVNDGKAILVAFSPDGHVISAGDASNISSDFIVIAHKTSDGSTTNASGDCNRLILEINRVTGRVSYAESITQI